MYRKIEAPTTVKEQVLQIRPILIAIEFDKKHFTKTRDIKNWFQTNYSKIGFVVDFENKDLRDEDNLGFYYQTSKIYKQPISETRIQYQEGVLLYYHFTEFQMKDQAKIDQLKKIVDEL